MKKSLLFLAFLSLTSLPTAFGSESIPEIAMSKEVKEQTIQHLQAAIERHQLMTREEILVDIRANFEKNAAYLGQQGLLVNSDESFSQLASLDRETIIALENMRLQSMMTSANWMFTYTRGAIYELGHGNVFWGKAILLPVVIACDLVFLPFTFLHAVFNGF